ncbi:MAG: M67 family metallopeptidase [Planctomycetes bacterium]|nr:M67 family metallopeptidase [Planctomycetota bacterium]
MPPFTRLDLPDALRAELIAHARGSVPLECCGLLAGHVTDGAGVVAVCYPIENTARSPTEYETDPRGMLFAFRSMRERGTELLAIYHSHPASEPVPSRRDVERNTYGQSVVHVIVGFTKTGPDVRAWWLAENGYREAELRITQI